MKNYGVILLFLAAVMPAFSGCKTGKGGVRSNLSSLYKKDASFLHPEFFAVHADEQYTVVHFRILSTELLYAKSGNSDSYRARYSLSWQLMADYGNTQVLDSGTVSFEDQFSKDLSKMLSGSVRVRSGGQASSLLILEMTDLNRSQSKEHHIYLERNHPQEKQNYFLGAGSDPGQPLFRHNLTLNEQVLFTHRSKTQKLMVRYYNRDFPLPPPPFSYFIPKGFDFKPDSLFTIEAVRDTFHFSPTRSGIYHFQMDTSVISGMTLLCFQENFPKMKTFDGMISPLRYLTTKNEFEKLQRYINKKAAVDSFWLSCAGNVDRGKDLIRKYYNRVHDANAYFTSYLEGWKSDRGIVYVVYGPPNVIYRNPRGESWVYGEENNINSLSFTFTRYENPFTTNDYRLERSSTYQDGWYKAANAWREGRIFIDN